jgi:hypothetical protein
VLFIAMPFVFLLVFLLLIFIPTPDEPRPQRRAEKVQNAEKDKSKEE